MSEEFAKRLIANLEKRKKRMLRSKSLASAIIYKMLDEQIDAIKETMFEMGHKL